MTFSPAIPIAGYGGWRVLQATAPRQQETFEKSPSLLRNIDYFRENISKAATAEDLVKDRRLLEVALGAFGLGDEINKRAFIQRLLESDVDDPSSLAGKLNEPRYKALVEAFDYGGVTLGTNVNLSSFVEDIVARYKSLQFERAVGEVDQDMRLAMNFKREIAAIAGGANVDKVGWFQIMGQAPLRELVSTALGLPQSLSQLDIDKQKEVFERKAQQLLGDKSAAVFADPQVLDKTIRRFFLFRQMEYGPSALTPGAGALTLLQNAALGGAGGVNLLLSQG